MADVKLTDLPYADRLINGCIFEISVPDGIGGHETKAASYSWFPKIIREIDIGDETTPLTTGLKKTFRWRNVGIDVIEIDCSLTIPQASGSTLVTIDVKKNGTSVFDVKPTFDNGQTTTWTATTFSVITSGVYITKDDEITIHVHALESGSAAAGLKVSILENASS